MALGPKARCVGVYASSQNYRGRIAFLRSSFRSAVGSAAVGSQNHGSADIEADNGPPLGQGFRKVCVGANSCECRTVIEGKLADASGGIFGDHP